MLDLDRDARDLGGRLLLGAGVVSGRCRQVGRIGHGMSFEEAVSGREVGDKFVAQHISRFLPADIDAHCKKIGGLQTCITTRVDALKG